MRRTWFLAICAALLRPARAVVGLRCYRERGALPVECPQGLSLSYGVAPPRETMSGRGHIVTFNLSSPFLPVRVETSNGNDDVPHANVHLCRYGVSKCSPFFIDRLTTSTPNTPANLTAQVHLSGHGGSTAVV